MAGSNGFQVYKCTLPNGVLTLRSAQIANLNQFSSVCTAYGNFTIVNFWDTGVFGWEEWMIPKAPIRAALHIDRLLGKFPTFMNKSASAFSGLGIGARLLGRPAGGRREPVSRIAFRHEALGATKWATGSHL